jgi:hypothetical protein
MKVSVRIEIHGLTSMKCWGIGYSKIIEHAVSVFVKFIESCGGQVVAIIQEESDES